MDMPFPLPEANVTGPDGRINQDISCIKCEYNLRTLLLDGRCPECGLAVGRSVLGDYLRFREPSWVETLAKGMNWIVAAIALQIVLGCAGAGVGGVMSARSGNPQQMMVILTLVQLVSTIVWFVGFWRVTTPDPHKLVPETGINARLLTRITVVMNLVLTVVNVILTMAMAGSMATAGPGTATATPAGGNASLGMVGGIVSIVFFFASFTYFRQMAKRVPNERLAKQTLIVMWGVIASVGAGIVAGILGVIMRTPAAGGPGMGIMATGMCAAGIGMAVFGIWSLLLIDRYRKAFNHAAKEARATWATVTPAAQPTGN